MPIQQIWLDCRCLWQIWEIHEGRELQNPSDSTPTLRLRCILDLSACPGLFGLAKYDIYQLYYERCDRTVRQ